MKLSSFVAALFCLCTPIFLQAQTETCDWETAFRIKQEVAKNAQIDSLIYRLIDATGPRLTGSDRMEAGYEAALAQMKAFGLENIRKEFARDWHRGGWDITKAYCAMTLPYYMHIYPLPVGWSGGTDGLKTGEVMIVTARNFDELHSYAGKVKGKIVLLGSTYRYKMNENPYPLRIPDEELQRLANDYPITGFGAPRKNRTRPPFAYDDIVDFLQKEGAIAVLNNSGDFNVPRTTHYDFRQGNKPSLCQLNITSEAHGLMQRMIEHGEKVSMEIEVAVKYTPGRKIYNIIGEIPGTDPALKDQIVMLGAHLDSHQGGTGATDNGGGCVTMLEAMRTLKALGIQPRRTIRIALWGGEEMGLHGSSGYVEQHVYDPKTDTQKEEYDKISVYFNADYGPGRFRGIYTQDNLMAGPIFRAWMEPYHDMGLTTVSNRSMGSTDHMPFDDAGIPGFQFIQDYIEWNRGAHQAMDYSDRLVVADLKHNAAVMAWFVYNAAMRDEMMPRKPKP